MKTRFLILLTTLLMLVGVSANAQYYWYVGTTEPTAASNPATDPGWTELSSKPDKIPIFAEDPNWNDVQWYIAAPAEWGFVTTSNGMLVGGWTKTTVTINGVLYNVWTAQSLKDTVNTTLTKLGNSTDPTYYWYAGPDMLTSETVPGINVENECSYGWHVITGNPTSIETGELGTSDCPKINWVLAVPTKFGLTRISNGEDITDIYDVSTVTTADGVEYIVFKQIDPSKKTDVSFVKGSSDEAKYFWYAGTTLPTADNIASIALGSSNTIEKWDGKEFSITNSGEESTPAYVCTPVDFKVSWKDMNGFTLNLVEVEGAGFTLNGIDYKVQKRGRDLSAGATITFKGYYSDSQTVEMSTRLQIDMYHEWDDCTATSKVTNEDGGGELHLGEPLGSGALVYGIESVQYQHYADLTGYSELVIEGTPDVILRVLINRLEVGNGGGDDNGGALTELIVVIGDDGTATVSLEDYPFVHLNAIKTAWHSPGGTITSLTLKKKGDVNGDGNVNVGDIMAVINVMATNAYDDRADVNQDGKVNVGDIMAVINIMAEK